jgi:hypothetical protein
MTFFTKRKWNNWQQKMVLAGFDSIGKLSSAAGELLQS